jgi:hypothetical protein
MTLVLASVSFVSAQSSVKGMNAQGITGVILTPTARIGWEKSDFGLDFTYSMMSRNDQAHIPAVTLSLYRKAEIALAYDVENTDDDNAYSNVLLGGKYQLYNEGGTSLAVGGNFETVTGDRYDDFDNDKKNSSSIYLVTTYGGDFFKLPAVTTMLFGWQVQRAGEVTSNLNYSMGFELGLFPETFQNYVYWISDFSNYSYAVYQDKISENRGIFNTGVRIDPLKSSEYKFVINLLGTDLMDEDQRGIMLNATFGMSF